jgi:hypothetical protein
MAASIAESAALCPDCGHVPREGFGCAGRPTPSDLWAGVYPGDCDCDCVTRPGRTIEA